MAISHAQCTVCAFNLETGAAVGKLTNKPIKIYRARANEDWLEVCENKRLGASNMTTLDNDNDRPQRLQRPELRGDPITATRYTSRDYFASELDNVWRRTWNNSGHGLSGPRGR